MASIKVIEIQLEQGPKGMCMGHWMGSRGCCWLGNTPREVVNNSEKEIEIFLEFLKKWDQGIEIPDLWEIKAGEFVRNSAGEVGTSGSPMALFSLDKNEISKKNVEETFRIAGYIRQGIKNRVEALSREELEFQPEPNRRSIQKTLQHIGNTVWWYCSRIDQNLEQWPDKGLNDFDRIEFFFEKAREFLVGKIEEGKTNRVYIPTLYPTLDPGEKWTARKVLRRQVEHFWEHYRYLDKSLQLIPNQD